MNWKNAIASPIENIETCATCIDKSSDVQLFGTISVVLHLFRAQHAKTHFSLKLQVSRAWAISYSMENLYRLSNFVKFAAQAIFFVHSDPQELRVEERDFGNAYMSSHFSTPLNGKFKTFDFR